MNVKHVIKFLIVGFIGLLSVSFFISDNVYAKKIDQRSLNSAEIKKVDPYVMVSNNKYVLNGIAKKKLSKNLQVKTNNQLKRANQQVRLSNVVIDKKSKLSTYIDDDIALERGTSVYKSFNQGENKIVLGWSSAYIYLDQPSVKYLSPVKLGTIYASRADINQTALNLGMKHTKVQNGIWIQKNYDNKLVNYGWQ